MTRITNAEAVKRYDVSTASLCRHQNAGKVSYSTDALGNRITDIAELERVYRKRQNSTTDSHEKADQDDMRDNAKDKMIALLEKQLDASEKRADRLLEMLSTEQEKSKVLMLAAAPEPPAEKKPKQRDWRFWTRQPEAETTLPFLL